MDLDGITTYGVSTLARFEVPEDNVPGKVVVTLPLLSIPRMGSYWWCSRKGANWGHRMSNSVKFRPRANVEKRPKAIQIIDLPDGGYKVVDATVHKEPGKERPVLFEYHPGESKKKRKAG